MKFDIKEWYGKINKKHVAILVGSMFFALAVIAGLVGYIQYQQTQSRIEKAMQDEEVESIMFSNNQSAEAATPKKPSDYSVGMDYNEAVKQNKPMVVLFYADWCRFCIGFMPKFEMLYGMYKDQYNFVKVNVEDEKYKNLVESADLSGFPSLFLMDDRHDNIVFIPNTKLADTKKLRIELDRFARISKLLDKHS